MGQIICTGPDCPLCEHQLDPRVVEALDLLGSVPDNIPDWLEGIARRRPELTPRDLVATYRQAPPPGS